MRIVLWEESVGLLQMNQTYNLKNITVRSFKGEKYLSCSHSFEQAVAADYGKVVDASAVHGSTSKAGIVGKILSVLSVKHYICLLHCLQEQNGTRF